MTCPGLSGFWRKYEWTILRQRLTCHEASEITQETTARVEERCRELRCGTLDSLDAAQRAFANRSLRVCVLVATYVLRAG